MTVNPIDGEGEGYLTSENEDEEIVSVNTFNRWPHPPCFLCIHLLACITLANIYIYENCDCTHKHYDSTC